MVKQVSFTPPPVLPLDLETEVEPPPQPVKAPQSQPQPQPARAPQGCTMAKRWRDIKTATGIEDGYFWTD